MSLHAMCVSICPGLQTAYYERQALYRHVRRLLALPFLPAEHIKEVEKRLKKTTPKLELDGRESGGLLGDTEPIAD